MQMHPHHWVHRLQAVIFDMDGVIVDSEPCHEQAFLQVVQEIGYADRHGIRFADYVGRSDHDLWVDFLRQHKPPQTEQQLLEMKSRRVVEIIRRERPLFEGLPQLVRRLAREYRLALASGSERVVVNEVLELDGLKKLFEASVSASETTHGKPAPDIFLRTAHLLGLPPEACCVIEDSRPGIAAARAAGMPVIAITNTHPAAQLAGATCVVKTYEEILSLLTRQTPAA
jgi:HAD superfamily hydrolase (TIGR01509 family)